MSQNDIIAFFVSIKVYKKLLRKNISPLQTKNDFVLLS